MAKAKGYDYMIEDVSLNWCKLGEPVMAFGVLQWELQIETDDEAQAEAWRENNLNVKETDDGTFIVGLKRKAQNANGTMKDPAEVVDEYNKDIDVNKIMIANGSRGNVIVHVFPYSYNNKSGWSASLNGVQITDLIEYKGSMKFSAKDGPSEKEMFNSKT